MTESGHQLLIMAPWSADTKVHYYNGFKICDEVIFFLVHIDQDNGSPLRQEQSSPDRCVEITLKKGEKGRFPT